MKTIHALKPIRTVAPAETPVSLSEVKAHLRVDHADEDSLIQGYLDAAVAHLDGWRGILGRCMVTQTWRLDLMEFPTTGVIRLPFPDCASVSVAYTDGLGAAQTLSASVYHLIEDSIGPAVIEAENQVFPVTDEIPDAVRVTGIYGYGAAANVPWSIKAAILLHVGTLYENREKSSERWKPTMAFEALIAPHRVVGI